MGEHNYTDLLTCPYCDYEHETTDLIDNNSSPCRTYQYDCHSCGKEFKWSFDVSVTFNSFESTNTAQSDALRTKV